MVRVYHPYSYDQSDETRVPHPRRGEGADFPPMRNRLRCYYGRVISIY